MIPASQSVGNKYGRLTVLAIVGRNHRNEALAQCLCECGNVTTTRLGKLRYGNTRSCGCLRNESAKILAGNLAGKHLKRHGMSNSSTYRTWSGMIDRCQNANNPKYMNYGGRGIFVCDEWKCFDRFLKEMGEKPNGKSIDRINNDGPYCKENCRWATPSQQSSNRRNNVFIDCDGVTMTITELIRKKGLNQSTVYSRLSRGWTIGSAITTPVRGKKNE